MRSDARRIPVLLRRGGRSPAVGGSTPAPVNTVAPVASGTVAIGQTLSCTTGTWSNASTFAYQWRRAGVNIGGATASTYNVVLADLGPAIDCVVTATGPGGSASADSNDLTTPPVSVVALISNANFWSTTAATRPALSTTSTIAVVCRKITAGNMVREYRIERFTSATRGFRFLPCHDGVPARTTATMVSSAPTNVAEQNTYSPTQNEFQVLVMVRNTTTLGIYRNGTLMSAAAAITGYSAPAAEAFQIIGNGLTDELEIASISISDSTALSAAQVTSYQSTVTALGSRIIPGATHHWEAADAGGATWTDSISGVGLTRNGSPVVRTVTAPVFT